MASAEVAKVGVEESSLRDYELVVILSPEVGDEVAEATVNNLSQFITGNGGTVASIEKWGKRKLAYPIKRFLEGNYMWVRFRLKPTLSRQLEANLRISEAVLRYLLVALEG